MRPGVFRFYIWNSVSLISSQVGTFFKMEFSSSMMQLVRRLSRCSRKFTYSSANKLLKEEKNRCLIWFELVTHLPSSILVASISFCLLLMMVERWKKIVLLSPSFSHSSRDFYFQRFSLLKRHFDSLIWSSWSILPLFSKGGLFWTSKILSINRLILTWQCPNTSLFPLWSASLVLACFL